MKNVSALKCRFQAKASPAVGLESDKVFILLSKKKEKEKGIVGESHCGRSVFNYNFTVMLRCELPFSKNGVLQGRTLTHSRARFTTFKTASDIFICIITDEGGFFFCLKP